MRKQVLVSGQRARRLLDRRFARFNREIIFSFTRINQRQPRKQGARSFRHGDGPQQNLQRFLIFGFPMLEVAPRQFQHQFFVRRVLHRRFGIFLHRLFRLFVQIMDDAQRVMRVGFRYLLQQGVIRGRGS